MLNEKQLIKISKKLSLILRHKPENFNIKLDLQGYAKVTEVLKVLEINQFDLDEIVEKNNKKRFAYSKNKSLIRASQGHSIENLKINFEEIIPPVVLYHGTASKNIDLIKFSGLKKMNRQYVHLSKDIETAEKVALRHSENICILEIDTLSMIKDGYTFWLSENNVYLADNIPFKYITVLWPEKNTN